MIGGNRFAMKKWSSSAFAWVCNGQEIALQSLRNLLSSVVLVEDEGEKGSNPKNYTDWNGIMQVSTVITETPTKSRKKGKGSLSDRKRANVASTKNKGSVVNIPGNLALLTYVSRVIDIVNEGGKMAGNSPQKNSAENYVNYFIDGGCVTETVAVAAKTSKGGSSSNSKGNSKPRRQSTRKSRESSSSVTTSSSPDVKADVVMSSGGKSKPKGSFSKTNQRKRTDIRNLAIVLMELLLAAHHNCLRDNVAIPAARPNGLDESIEMMYFTPKFPLEDGEVLGQIVLNGDCEDVDGGIPVLSMGHKKNLLAECIYFPQIHRTIETLVKCVSSVTLVEDCTTRLTGIGAALAMKYGTVINKLKAKESKHTRKAHGGSNVNTITVVDARLCSWAVCQLSTTLGKIISLSEQSSHEKNAVTQQNESTTDLVQRFSLDDQIIMTNQVGDQYTREYLGLFDENGHSGGEICASDISLGQCKLHGGILALFLRAMLSHNNKGGKKDSSTKSMLKLTEMLLRIVTCCYSLDAKDTINNNARRYVKVFLA